MGLFEWFGGAAKWVGQQGGNAVRTGSQIGNAGIRGTSNLVRTGAQVGSGALQTVYRAGQQFGAANPGAARVAHSITRGSANPTRLAGGALLTVYRAGQQFGAANPRAAAVARVFTPQPSRTYLASSVRAPAPVRIPNTPMRRGITPLPFSQFGTRYSPSTLTARVRNAGLEVAIRRDTRSARLVPNHFNSLGQQVYNRKAQTVRRIPDEPDIVANGIDARMRARTDRFLRGR